MAVNAQVYLIKMTYTYFYFLLNVFINDDNIIIIITMCL